MFLPQVEHGLVNLIDEPIGQTPFETREFSDDRSLDRKRLVPCRTERLTIVPEVNRRCQALKAIIYRLLTLNGNLTVPNGSSS